MQSDYAEMTVFQSRFALSFLGLQEMWGSFPNHYENSLVSSVPVTSEAQTLEEQRATNAGLTTGRREERPQLCAFHSILCLFMEHHLYADDSCI